MRNAGLEEAQAGIKIAGMPGSSPGGSRVIHRWGQNWHPWKNKYLITDI